MSKQRILIVDDEPDIRELLEITLSRMGLKTRSAEDYSNATRMLHDESFDLCLTDMKLPDGDGIALVEHIQQHYPNTPTAVITAHGSIDLAIKAMKCGAFDFVSKPVSLETLRNLVDKALTLPSSPLLSSSTSDTKYQIIGDSESMLELKGSIAKFARSQAPVFHPWRFRHRKRAGGTPDTPAGFTRRGRLHSGQLRRDSVGADGKRVFRASEGQLYRGHQR